MPHDSKESSHVAPRRSAGGGGVGAARTFTPIASCDMHETPDKMLNRTKMK